MFIWSDLVYCLYLADKALFGEDEWYFFTPRDKKYPNGSRPNRSAGSGYWKATGKDKLIVASEGSIKIGLKKALVFFTGSPAKSIKTNWIMSEYRLPESSSQSSRSMRVIILHSRYFFNFVFKYSAPL